MKAVFEFLSPRESEKPYTVSEINEGISLILEAGNTLVWVEGEISNYKRASSGHCYLKLKDESSQIPAVIWRTTATHLDFEPEEGMAVLAIARIRVYAKGGYYQLDIQRLQPSGLGALFAKLEKLKSRLEKEGLFDESHKKPLPETVRTVGVITAKTGAAIRDIVKVVAGRAPQVSILLRTVPVQGEAAAPEIALAIAEMNEHGAADILIVGRGGGSVEDLWAFNDERVARAIYASKIPVISAVGHEIDFTIADFVADVRAPTPSAAAEMAVPDERETQRYFAVLAQRFSVAARRYFRGARESLAACLASRTLRKPVRMVEEYRQRCDELHERLVRAVGRRRHRAGERNASLAARLEALSPLKVLSRGYSVVTTAAGRTVRSSSEVAPGDTVELRFRIGKAEATVVKTTDG